MRRSMILFRIALYRTHGRVKFGKANYVCNKFLIISKNAQYSFFSFKRDAFSKMVPSQSIFVLFLHKGKMFLCFRKNPLITREVDIIIKYFFYFSFNVSTSSSETESCEQVECHLKVFKVPKMNTQQSHSPRKCTKPQEALKRNFL